MRDFRAAHCRFDHDWHWRAFAYGGEGVLGASHVENRRCVRRPDCVCLFRSGLRCDDEIKSGLVAPLNLQANSAGDREGVRVAR